MAVTYTDNGTNTPNGSHLEFTYTFPTIKTDGTDVKVALNGQTQATNKYTVTTSAPTKITFNNNSVDSTLQESTGAPKTGVTVRVYRDTIVDSASAVYASGSSIRAVDLNANQDQVLYALQEEQSLQINSEDIADGAVNSAKILDGTIVAADIANDAIDSQHYAAGSIDLEHMSANSVNSSNIVDGSIVDADINASAAIAGSKLQASSGSNAGTMSAADYTKLTTIETAAKDNQTPAEIRAAVEAATDSNVFTDAEKTKLATVETAAKDNQTNAEIRAAVEAATDSNVFTDADHTKLNAIEASATADQTNAEIRAAVEAASDSNVFTDADHTKLNAIEASADVTDATNVNAAGAVMNSDLDGKGELLVGDGSGDPSALTVGTNDHVLTADSSEATGVKWAAIGAGSDTTYSISCVDGDASDEEKIRLTAGGSGSGTDDVVLEAGTGLSIARSGDKITFTNTVTDTTLTNEAVQDVVGAMFTGNTETNITATYQDADGTIDLVVSGGEITVQDEGSSLSTAATILNFVGDGVEATGTGATKTITIAGGGGATSTDFQYLELKAHNNTSGAFSAGSADYELVTKGTTTAVTPSQAASLLISIDGVIQEPNTGTSIGSNDGFCIDGSSIHFGANLATHPEFILYLKGAGVASIADNTVTGAKIALGSDASGDIMYYNGTDYVRLAKGTDGEVLKLASGVPSWAADAGLSQEQVEDYVGGMVTGNTETGITVTYEDSDGTLDFVVASQTDENFTTADHSKLDGIAASANNYVHPNHSGEVTSTADGATVIADDIVDEANLKISNAGSNGQFLSKQSGNTGGLTWATVAGTITALNNQAANRLTTIGSTTTELDGEANLTFDGTDLTVAAGGAVVSCIYENPNTLTANHTIGTNNNAMVAGPFSVGSATLTIPSGSVFTVI